MREEAIKWTQTPSAALPLGLHTVTSWCCVVELSISYCTGHFVVSLTWTLRRELATTTSSLGREEEGGEGGGVEGEMLRGGRPSSQR